MKTSKQPMSNPTDSQTPIKCIHCGKTKEEHSPGLGLCPTYTYGPYNTKSNFTPAPSEPVRETKPPHAKPQLYAYYFLQLKEIAKEFGYNLVIHGSMARDLDLIAIPWINDPKPELELIHAMHKYITGTVAAEGHEKEIYLTKKLPGGRTSYVININRGGYKKNNQGEIADPIEFTPDPQYYIDISVIARAPELLAELEQVKRDYNKLKEFKAYVHKRLDDAGIEKEPNGEHSKHGCRIGDRLDIVLDRITEIDDVLELVPKNESLLVELEQVKRLNSIDLATNKAQSILIEELKRELSEVKRENGELFTREQMQEAYERGASYASGYEHGYPQKADTFAAFMKELAALSSATQTKEGQ